MIWLLSCFALTALLFLFIRKPAFLVGMGVVYAFALLSLFSPPGVSEFIESLDFRTRDLFFRMRGPQKPTGDVIVIDIDNKSLEEMGQWPWPRAALAQAIRNIHNDGPKAIGFDIVFAEPDRLSLKDWAPRVDPSVTPPEDPTAISEEFIAWDNDLALAKAFYDCHVVAGGMVLFESSGDKSFALEAAKEGSMERPGMSLNHSIEDGERIFPYLRTGIDQVLNTPDVQQGALYQGAFNLIPDTTGVARYYHLLLRAPTYTTTLELKEEAQNLTGEARFNPDNYEEKILKHTLTYPSLALEMIRKGFNSTQTEALWQNGSAGVLLNGSTFLPLTLAGDIEINYRGFGGKWAPNSRYDKEYYFPYFSLIDVVQGRLTEGSFTDKYVVIGSTDPTLFDLVGSPFNSAYPGLEVHATLVDNILAGDILWQWTAHPVSATFLLILFGGTTLAIAYAYLGPRRSGILTVVILGGLPLLSYYLLTQQMISFPFALPWFTVANLSAAAILTSFFMENQDRRFVVEQFGKLVSQDVLEQLRENPGGASLGGRRARMSVMFSDLEGFTSISESMNPQTLVELLNDYLTPMTDVIMEHKGYVDKFIGDAIMACWGIPCPDPTHAQDACLAAIKQQEILNLIREPAKRKYGVTLNARMGISTGVASAAMMGSERKQNYTVLGDMVNLGARLEPTCKDYGVQILICSETYEQAKEAVCARMIDKIVVKGKTEPITIYELVGRKGEIDPTMLKDIEHYETALKAYWIQEWDQAIGSLKQIGSPDQACKVLENRIYEYKRSAPGPGWKGEYVKTTK